jgi:hypothetical protein
METTIVPLPFQHLVGQFLFIFHFGNKNVNFPEIPTIEVGEKKIALLKHSTPPSFRVCSQ